MRHLWGISFILAFFAISFAPVEAQSSIASVIDARTDLSALSAFLDAAPEMRERLESSGTYTLFAPNDTAFSNLESALNLTFNDMLNSPELVRSILAYHLLEDSLSANALIAQDGRVIRNNIAKCLCRYSPQ